MVECDYIYSTLYLSTIGEWIEVMVFAFQCFDFSTWLHFTIYSIFAAIISSYFAD